MVSPVLGGMVTPETSEPPVEIRHQRDVETVGSAPSFRVQGATGASSEQREVLR